uniref:SFRICE_032015 n=1 Tax=Spodoptera frugiperda TaxID=7108 RepID=A0A2H1X1W8_SPOFR
MEIRQAYNSAFHLGVFTEEIQERFCIQLFFFLLTGRRLCAGETYARQSMFQVFAGFMQTFHVSTADGKPLLKPAKRIQGIITTIPEFWVKVTVRK